MIISIRLNNYLVYGNDVELSLKANMKIKRFMSNTISCGNINAVKAISIYGANNVGKTCLIRAIQTIKNVLLSLPANISLNLFSNNRICSFGVTFSFDEHIYKYDFKFNLERNSSYGFIFEKFSELKIDHHGNETEKLFFLKDVLKQEYKFSEAPELEELMKSIAFNNILIYTINTEKYYKLGFIKDILIKFATSIEIVDLNNIPMEKTIKLLKDDKADKEKVIEIIKKADLDLDGYEYVKPDIINTPINYGIKPQENVLQMQTVINDMMCLTSIHKGKRVPSLFYDSTGTKKIVALASYIVDALENDKILVIDELDSSLHFKLTRAIVALFNNELNRKSQLIFTLHDITLLDCKKLFRKDQIWFAAKDNNGAYLYSLNDFTSKTGVRVELDVLEHYKKGAFGAIPEPDLISVLMKGE